MKAKYADSGDGYVIRVRLLAINRGYLPLASSIDYQSYFLARGVHTPISHLKYFREFRVDCR